MSKGPLLYAALQNTNLLEEALLEALPYIRAEGLSHYDALAVAERAIREGECVAIIDTLFEPVAIVGIVPNEGVSGMGWAILTKKIYEYPLKATRMVKRWIDHVSVEKLGLEYLYTTVGADEDNREAELRWAKALGFIPVTILRGAYLNGRDTLLMRCDY
jgi:hypothetical protein